MTEYGRWASTVVRRSACLAPKRGSTTRPLPLRPRKGRPRTTRGTVEAAKVQAQGARANFAEALAQLGEPAEP